MLAWLICGLLVEVVELLDLDGAPFFKILLLLYISLLVNSTVVIGSLESISGLIDNLRKYINLLLVLLIQICH